MSDRFFVGTRKGLFTVVRGPSGWKVCEVAFLADNVLIVSPDRRDGSVYAALAHGHFGGKMHRSPDGGRSWEEVGVPAYPEPPAGAPEEKCAISGLVIPWKLKQVWAIAPGGPDQKGVVWCGTLPGGLFRSEDAGKSWAMVRSLWDHPGRKEWFGGGADYPGIHSICVDPRDANRVLVGVSCGGAWLTTDGGKTWACRATGMRAAYMPPGQAFNPGIQDPHIVVQCPSQPDHYWVQHHNGIFRSTDGAESWQEITTAPVSSFGFATAVHPRDSNTAWFVPATSDERRVPVDARVVVTRTRDGGQSFDVLTRGLPQECAYDLTFRHALDIDQTGNRLAFGTTTGSVWVSEDGGDSWQTVSVHMPPVYCVRFA